MQTLLVVATACGKPNAPEGQVVVPASMTGAPGATGKIIGKILFVGGVPPMPELDVCGVKRRTDYLKVGHGGLADAVVRLKVGDMHGAARPPADPVVIDQKDCRFVPHVAFVVTGQKVAYRNSDTVMHDVRTSVAGQIDFHEASRPQTMDLVHDVPVPPGDTPYEISCDAHPGMEAHVLVGDQPYAAVTDEGGAFVIDGVPVGRHAVEVWHPHLGKRTTIVTVEAGHAAEAAFAPYQARDYKAP